MTTLANLRAWPALDRILLVLVAFVIALLVYASLRTAERALSFRGRPEGPTPADSSLAFDEIPLRSRDGTELSGWWIRPADGSRRSDLAVVVLAHDTGETRASLLPEASELARAGFIVLALDLRAHGASEGHTTTGGFLEAEDVAAGVGLAHERALGAPVLVFGEGSGAVATLRCAVGDPTIRGVGQRDVAMTYEQPLLARPEVKGDLLRWFSIPPLVRARMTSLVGRGYAPGEYAVGGSASRLGGRPIATFDEPGRLRWQTGRERNVATNITLAEWCDEVIAYGAAVP